MRLIFLFGLVLLAAQAAGQSSWVPVDPRYYHLLERYEIRRGAFSPNFRSSLQPLMREDIGPFADSLYRDTSLALSRSDRFNLRYLANDNHDYSDSARPQTDRSFLSKGGWGELYATHRDFYQFANQDLRIRLNPVIYWEGGADNHLQETPYVNTRGAEIQGQLGNKLGFYTFLADNQALLPAYVDRRIDTNQAVPHAAFWKPLDPNGVDFLSARGYFNFQPMEFITMSLGHDRHKVGTGYRSLILSDHSAPYLFLKINTKVWRLQYTNLFAEMKAYSNRQFSRNDQALPNKYLAFHRLGINLAPSLNIGVWEAAMIGAEDGDAEFRLDYLNPIIFTRYVEQATGSPDNAMIGFDWRWNFLRHFSFYGQIVIDEFLLENVRNYSEGWWANKHGGQAGLKYIDAFGLPNLDLQAELNLMRPFTYTHSDNTRSYTHYGQPLAHPLGANFQELVGTLRYQPFGWLTAKAEVFLAQKGQDSQDSVALGGDIMKNNSLRPREFGFDMLEGERNDLFWANLTLSFQPWHNVFIDLRQVIRRQEQESSGNAFQNNYTGVALRINIAERRYSF